MTFTITVAKNAPGENQFSGSVVSRESFSATVKASDTGYSGTVTLYANSPTDDTAYKLGTVKLSKGTGTVSGLKISSVFGTDPSRKITAKDSSGNTGVTNVGVWFRGKITNFSVDSSIYCGYSNRPSGYLVSLPAYNLCGEEILVYNAANGKSQFGKVWEVGPWFDANCKGGDLYWNKGTQPLAEVYEGQKRNDVCPGTDNYVINGAILDIETAMMTKLGGSGTITNGLWRFN